MTASRTARGWLRSRRAPACLVLGTTAALGLTLGTPADRPGSAASAGLAEGGFDVVAQRGGPIRAALVSGSVVWVTEGIGLTAIDLSRLDYPTAMAHTVLGAGADGFGLVAIGDHLAVGAADGVHLALPQPGGRVDTVGWLATPGQVTGLAGAGNRLLVSDAAFGLLVADVSDPTNPRVEAGIAMPGGASAPAAVWGGLAVAGGADIRILELGSAVVEVGRLAMPGPVAGLALGDARAYVSTGWGFLDIDLSDPAVPVIQGRLEGLPAGRVVAIGPSDLLVLGHAIRRIDVADPGRPRDVYGGPGPYGTLDGAIDGAFADGLLVAARGDRLTGMRIDDPERPRLAGSYESVWPVLDLDLLGRYAYTSKGPAGLDVVDTEAPGGPDVRVSYRPPGGVLGVAASGGVALISTEAGGQALDVGDPGQPIELGPIQGDWPATGWLAAAAGVGVAAGEQGLVAVDLTAQPLTVIGTLDPAAWPGWPADAIVQGVALTLDGRTAYLADGPAGVGVVDLGDPAQPRLATHVKVRGGALAVVSDGPRLLAGTSNGAILMDIANPILPVEIAAIDLGYPVVDASALEDGFLLAAGQDGLTRLGLDGDGLRVSNRLLTAYPFTHVAFAASGLGAWAIGAGLMRVEPGPESASPTPGTPVGPTPGATATDPPPVATASASPTGPTATRSPTTEPTSTVSPRPRAYLPWTGQPVR